MASMKALICFASKGVFRVCALRADTQPRPKKAIDAPASAQRHYRFVTIRRAYETAAFSGRAERQTL
jgi:hypothetical protein